MSEKILLKNACVKYLKSIDINTEKLKGVRDYMSFYNLLVTACKEHIIREGRSIYVEYGVFCKKANELRDKKNKTYLRNINEFKKEYGYNVAINRGNEQVFIGMENNYLDQGVNQGIAQEEFKDKYLDLLDRIIESENLNILTQDQLYEYIKNLRECRAMWDRYVV